MADSAGNSCRDEQQQRQDICVITTSAVSTSISSFFFPFEPSLIFHPPFDPAQSSQFIELFPEKRIPCFNSTCYLQLESSNNIDQTCISHCPGSDNNSRPTTKVPPRSSPRFDMHIRNAGFTESEQNGKSRLLPSEMSMH